MKTISHLPRVILYQNLGFLGILVLSYLDELLDLPKLIFSDHPFAFVYRAATLEVLLVLAVWFLVSMSTRRILTHVRYLEGFMRVCSWCRRIHYRGDWMPLEEFLRQGFDTPTTHGICTDCLHQQQTAYEKARQARAKAQEAATPNPPAGLSSV